MGTISQLKCNYPDCGHEWYPRTERLPKVCPKCKRYDWNKSPWEVGNEVKKSQATAVKSKKGASNR